MPRIIRLARVLRPPRRDILHYTIYRATLGSEQKGETPVGLCDDAMLRVEIEQRGRILEQMRMELDL